MIILRFFLKNTDFQLLRIIFFFKEWLCFLCQIVTFVSEYLKNLTLKFIIMKKVSLFFAALFVCAMVLTSCGGATTEATSDSTTAEPTAAPAADTVAADTTQVQ
jgi:hypothetical protein